MFYVFWYYYYSVLKFYFLIAASIHNTIDFCILIVILQLCENYLLILVGIFVFHIFLSIFYIDNHVSQKKKKTVLHVPFPNLYAFHFSFLISMVRVSNTMLNRGGKREHSYLIPILGGKHSVFHHGIGRIAVGLCRCSGWGSFLWFLVYWVFKLLLLL